MFVLTRVIKIYVFSTWVVGISSFLGVIGYVLASLVEQNVEVGRVIGMFVGVGVGLPIAWLGTAYRNRSREQRKFHLTDLIPLSGVFNKQNYTRDAAIILSYFLVSGLSIAGAMERLTTWGWVIGGIPELAGSCVAISWIGSIVVYRFLTEGRFDAKYLNDS